MKIFPIIVSLVLLLNTCRNIPKEWNGEQLTQPRNQITVEQLLKDSTFAFLDMTYFSKPNWANQAKVSFSGTITFHETKLFYPKEKEYYPGENIFPNLQLDFISSNGQLIPRRKQKIITRHQSSSYWDVIVGTGKIWHEVGDGEWNRASFPITLTDRWVGQARNCVATFIYKKDTISNVCLQCSQETADIDDKQLADIKATLSVSFQAKLFSDSLQIIEQHNQSQANRLPTLPLSVIDSNNQVAAYFDKMIYTNAPTSMGAVWMNGKLYIHPPKTRHGLYPYPNEMRHGLYSVTKSMAGALALMYFEARYDDDVFNQKITDYVPALTNRPEWQGVTFLHTLNMVTGTNGGEDAARLYNALIIAETAEEAIHNIAGLGDSPALPGQSFNYASTNLFVLSYALQNYVEQKEGKKVNYRHLVHENVLVPIGAENFPLLHTIEADEMEAIPILAFGALPTIDEAAKIALLFANEGRHNGQQILDEKRVKQIFGETEWSGYSTNNDFRGTNYQHSFWSKEITTKHCQIKVSYMLGFGENYIVFLPSKVIIFRFLDEHDLDIDELIKNVENLKIPR